MEHVPVSRLNPLKRRAKNAARSGLGGWHTLVVAPLALAACFGGRPDTEHAISVTVSIAESRQSTLAPGKGHLLVIEDGEVGGRKHARKVLMRLCPSDAGTAGYVYQAERRNCPKNAAFQAFIYETDEAVPVCGTADLPEAVDARTSRLVATSSVAVWERPSDCRSGSRSDDTKTDLEAVIL